MRNGSVCPGIPSDPGFGTGALDLRVRDGEHPITRGVTTSRSSTRLLNLEASRIHVLATDEEGCRGPFSGPMSGKEDEPFVSIPGHYSWTFDAIPFRTLVFRGIAWSARQPEHRLDGVVLEGARVQETGPSDPPGK
ncbi:MAG: hypothetical protein U1D30_07115 [Planctomycetota bacterium]